MQPEAEKEKREKKTKKRIIGLPPGTFADSQSVRDSAYELKSVYYSQDKLEINVEANPSVIPDIKPDFSVSWLNLIGLQNSKVLEKLGKTYNLNPLILEDIVSFDERPKIEFLDDKKQVYMVLKRLHWDKNFIKIRSEDVSIIFGPNYVLTFQESLPDEFIPILERIKSSKGRIRKMGSLYLAYVQLDFIVDQYFLLLDEIGEHISDLDEKIMENPDKSILEELHKLKRDMIYLRRIVFPMREVIVKLERDQRGDNESIPDMVRYYLRDLYDHIIQINETIEQYRDVLSNLLDTYLSAQSIKLNDIMKILTIISTIFIPLTLISGIYGMNFHYMPELKWEMGYPFAIFLMIAIVFIELYIFHKKGWLKR